MADEMKKLYTCVICYNLFDQATALKKCLHIFCWKCIYGKITQHNWRCCPVCYTDFGPDPLRRLRHDDPLLLSMEKNNLLPVQEDDEETETDEEYVETESESSDDDDEETESDNYEDMETGSETDLFMLEEEDEETESEQEDVETVSEGSEDEETESDSCEDMETASDSDDPKL